MYVGGFAYVHAPFVIYLWLCHLQYCNGNSGKVCRRAETLALTETTRNWLSHLTTHVWLWLRFTKWSYPNPSMNPGLVCLCADDIYHPPIPIDQSPIPIVGTKYQPYCLQSSTVILFLSTAAKVWSQSQSQDSLQSCDSPFINFSILLWYTAIIIIAIPFQRRRNDSQQKKATGIKAKDAIEK